MKKPVRMHGHFLKGSDMQNTRHTKSEARSIAVRSAKRAGVWPLVIELFDDGGHYVVSSHGRSQTIKQSPIKGLFSFCSFLPCRAQWPQPASAACQSEPSR